ncbi:serine/threonine-protein kinase [Actinomadura syzygii]|uniref:Serine/threonine protein kinase n=1 Tax=Actinomadura syzygii TaxID=1427538 RepID=A0A5D0TV95_9ACTN|nr:serine/threonine-protein kinase [Actinomadura syzygii]TYC09266.1 serine/threonine protein kinase [Actinomadura syzygii]
MEVGALRSGDPDRLGSYALIGRVGEGGQGTVFLGADDDGRQVAIKLLHAELTSDDKARARFLRELEVAKRVAPFCTAQVIDADADGERPYIVSEYVRGPSLNQQVMAHGPLDGAALDRLAVGTATALAAIHQAKIVHRDFKPHNVLIGPDGPRVIDFGVARALSAGTTLTSRVIGTPSYMAPEQIGGDEVGTPADVFCWAATLVFAATGEPPFGQDTIPAVINRILNEEPDLGDLGGALRELVLDCLEKDPADRPGARQVLMRLLGHDDASLHGPRRRDARPADDTDENAMLAAGSVRAAEAVTGDVFDPDPVFGDDPVFDDDAAYDDEPIFNDPEASPAAVAFHGAFGRSDDDPDDDLHDDLHGDLHGGLHQTPAEWAAGNTLPSDLDPVEPGDGAGRGRGLRGVLAGSGRSALLAGAAALFVAIVVVSSVLALSSGDNGKAGQKVADPSAPPTSSGSVPSMELPASRKPAHTQTAPTYQPTQSSESPSDSPTPTSPTPSATKPTKPTPTDSHGPTDPSSGPGDPSGPPDPSANPAP